MAQVEGADSWSCYIQWQILQLVVGEIKMGEVRAPFFDHWNLGELVVR